MAVNITGGGLEFDASIDDSKFHKTIRIMESDLEEIAKAALLSSVDQKKAIDAVIAKWDAQSAAMAKSTSTAKLKEYQKNIRDTESEITKLANAGKDGYDDLGNSINRTSGIQDGFMNKIKSGIAVIAAYFTLDALIGFGKQILNVTAEFQKLNAVLGNTLGSKSLANLAMKQIEDFAAKTPFSVNELTDSFVKLANQGFVPTGSEMIKLGDLASSTGKSFNQLAEAILDAMSGENERLKEFGVKAKVHGDQVTYTFKGVSTTVDNTADSIRKYINSLGELEGVTGSMAVISKTLTGEISNLGDSWDQMLKSFGDGNTGVFAGAISFMKQMVDNVTELNKGLNTTAKYNLKKDRRASGGMLDLIVGNNDQADFINQLGDGLSASNSKFIEGAKYIREYNDELNRLKIAAENDLAGVQDQNLRNAIQSKYNEARQQLKDAAQGVLERRQIDKPGLTSSQIKALEVARKKLDKENERSLKAAETLEEKISDINDEYARKSLSKDEEEIQATRDKFKRLAAEVQKFNGNPKNKYKVDGSSLDKTRDAAISDLTYKQETERLKISLEEQKALYAEFEDYQSTVGLQKAKELFKSRIEVEKTYLKQLEAEREKIANVDDGSLTAGQLARLESLNKLIDAEKAIREKAYLQTFASTLSLEEKIDKARREYLKRYDELLQGSSTKTLTPEQIKALQVARDASIDAAKDEAFQTTEIYKELNRDITYYTQEQLRIKIKSLQEFLDSAKNLPEELKNSLSFELNTAKSKLGSSSDDNYIQELENRKKVIQQALKAEKLSTQEYQKQLKALEDINNEINKVKDGKFDKDLSTLKAIGGFADELSSAFEGVNDEISAALSGISQIAAVGGNAIGAGKSFLSGDILGGITQSISAIGGIIKLIGGDRAAQRRETAAYFTQVFEGELEYARMMRARQSIQENITSLTIRELEARKDMLSGQSSSAQDDFDKVLSQIRDAGNAAQRAREEAGKSFGALKSNVRRDIENSMLLTDADYDELERLFTTGQMTDKVKALFVQLREAKKEMEGLADAGKETDEVLSKIRTGTTAQDLATSLSDMFKSGKTGVEDFADFFENTMKNAIFSTFEANVLNKLMEDFYKTFDEKAKDGINQTDIDELRNIFDEDVIKAGNAQLEALKQATGLDFGSDKDSSPNSMKGAVERAITEETGSLIVGQFNGLRMTAIEQLSIAKSHLDVALKIEANTLKTATNTEHLIQLADIKNSLKSMDAKMNNTTNALSAGGIKP